MGSSPRVLNPAPNIAQRYQQRSSVPAASLPRFAPSPSTTPALAGPSSFSASNGRNSSHERGSQQQQRGMNVNGNGDWQQQVRANFPSSSHTTPAPSSTFHYATTPASSNPSAKRKTRDHDTSSVNVSAGGRGVVANVAPHQLETPRSNSQSRLSTPGSSVSSSTPIRHIPSNGTFPIVADLDLPWYPRSLHEIAVRAFNRSPPSEISHPPPTTVPRPVLASASAAVAAAPSSQSISSATELDTSFKDQSKRRKIGEDAGDRESDSRSMPPPRPIVSASVTETKQPMPSTIQLEAEAMECDPVLRTAPAKNDTESGKKEPVGKDPPRNENRKDPLSHYEAVFDQYSLDFAFDPEDDEDEERPPPIVDIPQQAPTNHSLPDSPPAAHVEKMKDSEEIEEVEEECGFSAPFPQNFPLASSGGSAPSQQRSEVNGSTPGQESVAPFELWMELSASASGAVKPSPQVIHPQKDPASIRTFRPTSPTPHSTNLTSTAPSQQLPSTNTSDNSQVGPTSRSRPSRRAALAAKNAITKIANDDSRGHHQKPGASSTNSNTTVQHVHPQGGSAADGEQMDVALQEEKEEGTHSQSMRRLKSSYRLPSGGTSSSDEQSRGSTSNTQATNKRDAFQDNDDLVLLEEEDEESEEDEEDVENDDDDDGDYDDDSDDADEDEIVLASFCKKPRRTSSARRSGKVPNVAASSSSSLSRQQKQETEPPLAWGVDPKPSHHHLSSSSQAWSASSSSKSRAKGVVNPSDAPDIPHHRSSSAPVRQRGSTPTHPHPAPDSDAQAGDARPAAKEEANPARKIVSGAVRKSGGGVDNASISGKRKSSPKAMKRSKSYNPVQTNTTRLDSSLHNDSHLGRSAPSVTSDTSEKSIHTTTNTTMATASKPSAPKLGRSLSRTGSGMGSIAWRAGLRNLGNTCYLNSTVQCLSATTPLVRYFLDNTFQTPDGLSTSTRDDDGNMFASTSSLQSGGFLGRDGDGVGAKQPSPTKSRQQQQKQNAPRRKPVLSVAFANLLKQLKERASSVVEPSYFKNAIDTIAQQFRGTDQHDSQEFLGFLLDTLHEELNASQTAVGQSSPNNHKQPQVSFSGVVDLSGDAPAPPSSSSLSSRGRLESVTSVEDKADGGSWEYPSIGDTVENEESAREWNKYREQNRSIIVDLFQGQLKSKLECLTCHY
ncbi:ubiquitin-specific protease doa4, partial [Quaeritorhiza haematococci]